MLNSFPDLLTYSLLAPFILRVVAGFIFINLGVLAFKNEKGEVDYSLATLRVPNQKLALKILGAVEIIGGISFILEFYTQITTLVLGLLTFAEAYVEYQDPAILKRNFIFYIMLLAIILSLLLSGAGAFAFDLPL